MKLQLIIILLFLGNFKAFAAMDTVRIPVYRQFFHDKINDEQLQYDKMDGRIDKAFNITSNDEVNLKLSDAVFRKIDELQDWIEVDSSLSTSNYKIKSLGYLENALHSFRISYNKKEIQPAVFPVMMDQIESIIKAPASEKSVAPFIVDLPYGIAKMITNIFTDNIGYKDAQNIVYLKFCQLHPDEILKTIRPFIKESFADSLIGIACYKNPAQLYTYAQSTITPEGKLIHSSTNPSVMAVAKLSQTPNALFYFPFLDDILSGKNSVENIQKFVGDGEIGYDSVGYFRLLVKTEIAYYNRMIGPARDTPIAMFGTNGLRDVLKNRAIRHFITPINTLHNENNLSIRMHAIDPLTAEELYYMLVLGENDIYTSSYKHSFNRLLQLMGSKAQFDSLFLNVRFDYFKKFIKMAANYNKLDTLLKSMSTKSSEALMKAFVANLDKSNSLEDVTDVADSYSSINNKKLLLTILDNVKENEEQCINDNNEKGKVIYGLHKNIFLSSDTAAHIDLKAMAGIPSIYEVDKKTLQDDSGRVIQQVFFYGDEDGKVYFPLFLNSFSAKEWKITRKQEWVEIKSIKDKIWIFANQPLDYDANLDDSAQVHLNDYLEENNLYPSVVIHRGHSYWLPGTISRMSPNAKIVILGSCGGYKNLNKILEVSPDAHIISTKEIGAGDINRPILNSINQALLYNNKIVWKDMWSSLNTLFAHDKNKNIRESWDNYIPPYRNLGAIFIKAYNNKMGSF